MKLELHNVMFSSDSGSGAEQRAEGADPEAGVGLAGRSSGHQHAARGSDASGSGGAAGVPS